MESYPSDMQIREALMLLFKHFNFPADAYTASYFTIPVFGFPIKVPNTASRVKVAKFHDIHHVLTGYGANWKGEAEIGAWEIATGCRNYFIAWFLNAGAVFVGLFMYPRAVFKAYRRGLKTKTNLYHDFEYEALLEMSVQELRERIGLN